MSQKKTSAYPILLSLESSGTTCGVALAQGGDILAEYSLFIPNVHGKFLAELTRRALEDVGVTYNTIDAVCCSAGPGSFTGLRIGLSFAKALCFEHLPNFIGVPTLQALAWAARDQARKLQAQSIVAVIESHKDLVYRQVFTHDAEPSTDAAVVSVTELVETFDALAVYCGPGARHVDRESSLADIHRLSPRWIADLGWHMYQSDSFADASSFAPLYVQDFIPKTKSIK